MSLVVLIVLVVALLASSRPGGAGPLSGEPDVPWEDEIREELESLTAWA